MLRITLLSLALVIFLNACNSKKENEATKGFIPVNGIILGQVAHVDTSLFSIMRFDFIDTARTDTSYIHRDQFRAQAIDFIDLPDYMKDKNGYREEKFFDDATGRVVFSYLPEKPEKSPIQRVDVSILPNEALGDKIVSIFIDYLQNNKDSSVQKKMIWQMDKSFQVTKMVQLPGKEENVKIFKVSWNEQDGQ